MPYPSSVESNGTIGLTIIGNMDTKTKVLVTVPPKHTSQYQNTEIRISDAAVKTINKAKVLGVIFASNMEMVTAVDK